MTSTVLPAEWVRTTLGDVATLIRNGTFASRPDDDPDGLPILRISAVRAGVVDMENVKYVHGLEARRAGQFAVRSGDLLFTRYNGSRHLVGICGVVPPHSGPVLHPDKLIRVVVSPEVADSHFIAYQMASGLVRDHLEPRIRTTAGQSGISGVDVKSIPVILPPLAEQRRIVDILDDHLSRLDAADQQTRTALQRANAWKRAHADELFWGGGFPTEALGEVLAAPMRNGHSARASSTGTGIRTLTLTAVTRGQFTDDFTKVTSADPERVADLWLRQGDILVQRSNTPELVGTTELYTGPDEWAIFPDLLIRCRVDTTRVVPAFAAEAMRTERAHRWLRSRAKGLAGSMPKIDQGTIAALRIPVPALAQQTATVAQLAEIDAPTRRFVDACNLATWRSAGLRRALLRSAFTGRLTRTPLDDDQPESSDV